MKSRTLFFNKTVYQKDLTRFAPAWGICLILMLLSLIGMMDRSYAYYRLQNVRDSITVMTWLNLIYGCVVAQLLFGDLFQSRMCNALHSLPLRRECWFGSHVASGIAFSLLPNLVITLIALPIMRLGNGWISVFWWLLASELQYLFFFGIAVLCVMLSGNRLGQLALYGIIQFAGPLSYWLVSMIYQPFLHGIKFSEVPFVKVSPLVNISTMSDVLVIDYEKIFNTLGELENYQVNSVAPGNGWGYMAICAGVGILALTGALVLYRKRKLECSGDFVAFTAMEPVVTVIVTVFAGVFFHLFADAFGMNLRSVMLGTGMVLGFFGCRMLLERTTRVFRKKAFIFCGCILAIFGLTVLLTYLDPVGVTRYIPETEEIESVTFSRSYSHGSHNGFPCTVTTAEEIEELRQVHADGISKEAGIQPGQTADVYSDELYTNFDFRIEYKLKNGKTVNRFYDINPKSEAGIILKDYFTRPECVIGITADQVKDYAPYVRSIFTQAQLDVDFDVAALDIEGMLNAIIADCEAGNMAQISSYHYPHNYDLLGEDKVFDDQIVYLEIGWDRELLQRDMQNHPDAGGYGGYGAIAALRYTNLQVYRSCENTLKWMEEHNLLSEEALEELHVWYDGPDAVFETVSVYTSD